MKSLRMQTVSDLLIPRVGGILSADIAVPEHEREIGFYSRVLCTGEDPLWQEDLLNNRGMPIIGLGERSEEYVDLPLQWMPHIQVADVAASWERALSLGASGLMHGKGDNGISQWAVLLDLNGAAFGIVPVVSADALPPTNGDTRVGCISWLDLTVSGASLTRDFYRQVVGWSVEDVETRGASDRYADYNMLGDDGNRAAGICHARGIDQEVPPVWMIYLPVGDLAESLRRVSDGGGSVIRTERRTDGEYAYAVIQDPVGACLALMPG
ncbi:MAG: VOC family protein [Pseudomonadota bacterium]